MLYNLINKIYNCRDVVKFSIYELISSKFKCFRFNQLFFNIVIYL